MAHCVTRPGSEAGRVGAGDGILRPAPLPTRYLARSCRTYLAEPVLSPVVLWQSLERCRRGRSFKDLQRRKAASGLPPPHHLGIADDERDTSQGQAVLRAPPRRRQTHRASNCLHTPRSRNWSVQLPYLDTGCILKPRGRAGGAERLVVDAAVGLQKRGHTVEVFTSHHEDGKAGRSFEETRDGESYCGW